jgi:hypothetical protein
MYMACRGQGQAMRTPPHKSRPAKTTLPMAARPRLGLEVPDCTNSKSKEPCTSPWLRIDFFIADPRLRLALPIAQNT